MKTRLAFAPVLLALAALSALFAPPLRAQDGPIAAEPDAPPSIEGAAALDALGAPVLESVEFLDRTYFKDETIRTFLLHAVPGDLDEALLRADAARIETRYQERGFLRAKVQLRVVPSGTPRGVRGVFLVAAGERAELKRVNVIGNVLVPEAALKEGFFSRPPEPLGALTRAGFFHKPYLDQDAQRLVANYYKRGHLEARVIDTRVEADAALDGLSVTMRVSEGPEYELGALKLEGELPTTLSLEQMRARINVKDGDVCDLVSIQQQADSLLDPLRFEGHPFASFQQSVQVMAPPSGNAEHKAVELTLKIVRGPKPTVREVRISGNKGTQDRVVLRDIAIEKGKPYDHAALKKTERALLATGIFAAAQARAVPTDDPSIVDVEVVVTEQPQTWLFSVAPAFDTSVGGEGLIVVGVLADRNLLGTGLFASTFVRFSGLKQTFDLTVSEPRLLDTRISLTGEVHRREISFFDYRVRSEMGGGFRVSIPVVDRLFVGAGLGAEYGGVVPYQNDENDPENPGDPFDSPPFVYSSAGEYGLLPRGVFRNPVSLSVTWDQRDSLLSPRNGVYLSASSTYAGPFTLSGSAFVDSDATVKGYWTPAWGITLKSSTQGALVFNPHGGDVPVTDRYFLGGLGSVRGFPALSLGPVIDVPLTTGATLPVQAGGVVRFVQNLEIEFPLWPDTPFRGFGFLDAGNTWSDEEIEAGKMLRGGQNVGVEFPLGLGLYTSTGFGVLLETPVFPIRFEWSVPLTSRRNFDRPISFFVGVGSAF